MRVIVFLLLIICCTSCDYFSFKKDNNQALDTIINFNKVDVSPSFEECKDKIDAEKTICFRTSIHKRIAENLAQHQLKIKDSINEVVTVALTIANNGKVSLQEIISSDRIKAELPQLDSLLQTSVNQLPIIFPAIKRGIPVATQYSLPIRIQLQE